MCQSCELINSEEIINKKELVFTKCNIDKLELVNEDHYLDELCIQFNNDSRNIKNYIMLILLKIRL